MVHLNPHGAWVVALDYANKAHCAVYGHDPLIVAASAHVIGRDERILGKSFAMDHEKKHNRSRPD